MPQDPQPAVQGVSALGRWAHCGTWGAVLTLTLGLEFSARRARHSKAARLGRGDCFLLVEGGWDLVLTHARAT